MWALGGTGLVILVLVLILFLILNLLVDSDRHFCNIYSENYEFESSPRLEKARPMPLRAEKNG